MHSTTFEIRPDLRVQLDHLAAEVQRSESDLLNEAVSLYLAQQYRITQRIQEGWLQAQQQVFVPDAEMDAFFAAH